MERLWTSSEQVPAGAPTWIAEQRRHISEALLAADPTYPCHFGTIGERGGINYYTYLDSEWSRAAEMDVLARAVATFLAGQAAQPLERMSLLIMVGPPRAGQTLDQYRDSFWSLLIDLSARDEHAALEPVDPADPLWNFNFAGYSLFVFGTCPAYGPRRSRVLADCLVVALQSRSVFRTLSGEAGPAAKRRIRRSLAAYEDVPLIADTGDGQSSTVEKWKQYMPDVDGRPATGTCPYPFHSVNT